MLRKIPALALFFLLASPAMAGEALVNSEVTVDVAGKDAADARTQAMAKAESDALKALVSKLATATQAESIISSMDAKKIAAMARGTEVLEEKISDNRYRASLRVSFDADMVSALITKFSEGGAQQDISIKTGSFLMIPSYEEEGTVMLWEEKSPWRMAWKMLGLEINTGDIIVPYGDNTDQGILSAKTLDKATYSNMSALAIRYGVSDIVILQAKFTKTPDMLLTVVKRRTNRTQNAVNVLTYRADPQETRDMLLARAARDIVDNLQNKKTEEISNAKGVLAGEKNKVMLLASITTLDSWIQLKSKLASLPMIERLELLAASPQQMDMVVHYRGTPESLANGITGQKLRLTQNQTYWVVSKD